MHKRPRCPTQHECESDRCTDEQCLGGDYDVMVGLKPYPKREPGTRREPDRNPQRLRRVGVT